MQVVFKKVDNINDFVTTEFKKKVVRVRPISSYSGVEQDGKSTVERDSQLFSSHNLDDEHTRENQLNAGILSDMEEKRRKIKLERHEAA